MRQTEKPNQREPSGTATPLIVDASGRPLPLSRKSWLPADLPGIFREPLSWLRLVTTLGEKLPRLPRYALYGLMLFTLPVYLGLVPRLLEDLLKAPLERVEIRLGWLAPLAWTGRIVEGAFETDAPFARERWQNSAGTPLAMLTETTLHVETGGRLFYRLKSPVHSLYDFIVELEVTVAEVEGSVAWILRANDKRDAYYEFHLRSAKQQAKVSGKEQEPIPGSVEAFAVENGQKQLVQANDRVLELPPFAKGSKLQIRVKASGCVFDHRLELEGHEPHTLTFFAEKPCLEYGDVGLSATPGAITLKRWSLCSFRDAESAKQYCPAFQ